MKTSEEYFADLKRMKPNLYIGGERVGRNDSRVKPGINVMSATFDMAQCPELKRVVSYLLVANL